MRIAQVSTSATRAARDGSGSIEGLVWLLARELVALGHEVTVFAVAGSDTAGRLVATLPGPYGRDGSLDDWQLCEWISLCKAVEQSSRFDVIHSHAYLWGLPLGPLSAAPIVHTLHTCAGPDQEKLRRMYPDAYVTAISEFQWRHSPQQAPCAVIHHGIDQAQFPFCAEPGDYVCYLGRLIPQKGPLQAIRAARALGLRLQIAGPATDYYRETLSPLVDGVQVQYIGPVSGSRRSELLSRACAMLYPIEAAEPFGLVMAEAMMCGTPVVAMRRGAVSELIDEGITGYSATTQQEFCDRIPQAMKLDRKVVRQTAERRFSARRMAREYERLYQRVATSAPQHRHEERIR